MNFKKLLDKLAKADLTEEQENQVYAVLDKQVKTDEADQKVDTAEPNSTEKEEDKAEQKSLETETPKQDEEESKVEVKSESTQDIENTTAESDQENGAQDSNPQVSQDMPEARYEGRSIDEFVLKEDVNKQNEANEARIKSLEKQLQDLQAKLEESQEKAKGLEDKYESKSFGEYSAKYMGEEKKNTNAESFDSYWTDKNN
jgi:hypothetical protein